MRQPSRGRVRLDRALSKLGVASRAAARELIHGGKVCVEGCTITDPAHLVVPETARITVAGEQAVRAAWRTILLHKPRGTVTTRHDPEGRQTVFDLLGGEAGASFSARGAPPPLALARPSTMLGTTLSLSKGRRRRGAALPSNLRARFWRRLPAVASAKAGPAQPLQRYGWQAGASLMPQALVAAGRLDLASSGLLVLTTDTRFADWLTDPANAIVRRYAVTVRGRLEEADARRMEAGIDDMSARSVLVRKRSNRETHLIVELTEGKNREIRRLCAAVGHEVTALKRLSFGGLELGQLQPGEWREVSRAELRRLFPAAPFTGEREKGGT